MTLRKVVSTFLLREMMKNMHGASALNPEPKLVLVAKHFYLEPEIAVALKFRSRKFVPGQRKRVDLQRPAEKLKLASLVCKGVVLFALADYAYFEAAPLVYVIYVQRRGEYGRFDYEGSLYYA